MQPVELCILRVPEEILLYLQWIVEYGAAFVQYDLPVIQDKIPLSLVDIDDLKISSAILPVCVQIPAAVSGDLAAAVDQEWKRHVIVVKILVV